MTLPASQAKGEGFKLFYYPVVDIHDMALVVAVASISRWA